MHILMVSDVYFPRINGVSTSIETFRTALARHDVKITLIAPHYTSDRQVTHELGDVIRIPGRPVPRDPEDRLMSYRATLGLLPQLRAMNIDAVHIQTPFVAHYAGLALARRLGVPCMATYHTFFEEYLHHYLPFLPRHWMRAAARQFSRSQCNALDTIVVPSSAMRDKLAGYGINRPLQVLPTGIPKEIFIAGDGPGFRKAYGIPPERPVALYVGRVAFEKNIDFLLRVIEQARRELPEVLLLVAGEGPALHALQVKACGMNLEQNVRFVGYLDRHQGLLDCYSAADVFAFASRTETQGLVLLEAMAQNLPVLALAEMGTREVLNGCGGAEIANHDVADFSSRLVHLLRDPSRRSMMAASARAHAEAWGAVQLARLLHETYRSLTHNLATATYSEVS